MQKIKYIDGIKETDIATLMKQIRKDKGLTQQDLADRSGLTISAISRYESGSRVPQYDSLVKIIKALEAEIIISNN
jgi:transcriptional regulator with XRE-family HTH domain